MPNIFSDNSVIKWKISERIKNIQIHGSLFTFEQPLDQRNQVGHWKSFEMSENENATY